MAIWVWLILLVALLVLLVLVFGLRRVKLPRQASFEGIEDEEVVHAYDRISRWPQFKLLRQLVVRELKAHNPEGTLADIGCGPGYLIANMAKAFPRLSIIGVDIAEEMVQQAADNLASLGLAENVSFRQGDIEELPFEDNSLDFVVSTLSLHHWTKPERALQEVNRVLKHGGQFLIFDLRRDCRKLFYLLLRFATACVVPVALRRVNEPLGSALSSYTLLEAKAFLRGTAVGEWCVKPGPIWLFIWGCKN